MRILCEKRLGRLVVRGVVGDITEIDVDAIVNPANSSMLMGGGVAGAIKRKGGEVIEEEARRHAPVPVGEAVATSAGRLRARYVIHAPTMEEPAMKTTPEKVYRATRAAVRTALKLGIKGIAVPGMGTGVGGLGFREAAEAMIKGIVDGLSEGCLEEIVFIDLKEDLVREFCRVLEEVTEEIGARCQ